jgi:hypothetical protein
MQDKTHTESGAKAYQRADNEDRAKEYMLWHRNLDRSLLMLDVDAIEWRFRSGVKVPVGIFEITRVDVGKTVNDGYLNAITARFFERDFQSKAAITIAQKLGTKAYITLFRQGCTEFWVYCLSEGSNSGWRNYATPAEYETFLKGL